MSVLYNAVKKIIITVLLLFIAPIVAEAQEFEVLDIIESQNNVFYLSMYPNGNYIAIGEGYISGIGIDIIDVSNPRNLELVTHHATGHMTYYLVWEGNYIYAPASWDGLFIYYVSQSNHILFVSNLNLGVHIGAVAIIGDYAIVGGSDRMFSINISNPNNPFVVWTSPDSLGFEKIIVSGTVAFGFKWCEDVIIFDVSNPAHPTEISRIRYVVPNNIDLDADRGLLYLTCWQLGLFVYDVSDPELPQYLGQTTIMGDATCVDVAVASKSVSYFVFVSVHNGLWAVDVSNPYFPEPITDYQSGAQSRYVRCHEDLIFHTIDNSLVTLKFPGSPSGIDDNANNIVNKFDHLKNYPNPFNSETIIDFYLTNGGPAVLEIFDTLGRRVSIIENNYLPAGNHSIVFDASNLPSGTYLYNLKTEESSFTQKMQLIK